MNNFSRSRGAEISWFLVVSLWAAAPPVATATEHCGDNGECKVLADVIDRTVHEVASTLEGRQKHFRDHPEELYVVIDEILLPSFDIRYAGYKVMGAANWKVATKEQRQGFVNAFYQFMLRNYATGLLRVDLNSVEILPDLRANERFAAVETTVVEDSGQLIPVDYHLRKSEKAGWRVYDVRIEGVSYVDTYGNQFAAEIDTLGLDAVIARMRAEIASGGAAGS